MFYVVFLNFWPLDAESQKFWCKIRNLHKNSSLEPAGKVQNLKYDEIFFSKVVQPGYRHKDGLITGLKTEKCIEKYRKIGFLCFFFVFLSLVFAFVGLSLGFYKGRIPPKWQANTPRSPPNPSLVDFLCSDPCIRYKGFKTIRKSKKNKRKPKENQQKPRKI